MSTMRVKPLVLEFTTAREIAEYYFNREFDAVPLDKVKTEEGIFNLRYPSDSMIVKDFIDQYQDIENLKELYREEVSDDMEGFNEWLEDCDEFDEFKHTDWSSQNDPMWGYVFRCPEFYVDSDYMDVDKLYQLGIGVLEDDEGDTYLYISGAGYDFYDAHWIPLFKELGWIVELKDEEDGK